MNHQCENPGYLILTADFPPIEGGISTVTVQLAEGLHRKGRLAAVAGPRVRGHEIRDSEEYPYPVFRLPGYHWGPLRALPAAPTLHRWMEAHPERVGKLIAMNAGFGGWLAARHSKRWRLPFDVFAYGFDFMKFRNNPLARRLLLSIYRKAGRVLSISQYTTEQLIDFGASADNIVQIPLGVDTNRFHPEAEGWRQWRNRFGAERKRVLLSVGRLVARKGQHLVLHALQKVVQKHPQVEYWIAGRGPERARLESLCEQLALKDHVRFLDYVPDDQLPGLYCAADLFVLPARQVGGSVEGYGLVFLEAAACGVPSVAGRSGGVPEAVLDGRTGLLVDSAGDAQLTQAILSLLDEPARLSALAEAAHARASELSSGRMLEFFPAFGH